MADLGAVAELALGRAARPSTVDTGGAFTVRELTGQMRSIVLTGRGLPYRPFELETTQRLNVTWLPGYAVATATILGAAEEPTTINGFWKERFVGQFPGVETPNALGAARGALVSVSASLTGGFGQQGGASAPINVDGKPVATVQEAADLFDDVVRQGQLLEMTWASQTRHGHLRSFKKRWHNTRDVEWDMTFEWTSRGDPVASAVHALDVTAQDTRMLLESALDDCLAIMAELPAITRELTDLVDSQLQKIFGLVASVGDSVQAASDAVLLPVDTTKRIIGLLESIEGECANTATILESKPAIAWHQAAEAATRVGGTATFAAARASGSETGHGGAARLSIAQRVEAQRFVAEMKMALRREKQIAVQRRMSLARQVRSEIAGTYHARQGDDLRDVAFQFYGNPNEWRRIMLFNGLSSGALVAGQIVRVPRLSPDGAAGDI